MLLPSLRTHKHHATNQPTHPVHRFTPYTLIHLLPPCVIITRQTVRQGGPCLTTQLMSVRIHHASRTYKSFPAFRQACMHDSSHQLPSVPRLPAVASSISLISTSCLALFSVGVCVMEQGKGGGMKRTKEEEEVDRGLTALRGWSMKWPLLFFLIGVLRGGKKIRRIIKKKKK